MATPLGHSIVGLLIARAFGVESLTGRLFAIGAASLPDVDVPVGHLATGEPLALHHKMVTHEPPFALAAGLVTGAAAALRWGPGAGGRAGAFTTALVGSHLVMDLLPLPYDTTKMRSVPSRQAVLTHAWNWVIDLAVYGGLAVAIGRLLKSESAT
jgi:LexA-binding, inner membrane-associated putative hydrolase